MKLTIYPQINPLSVLKIVRLLEDYTRSFEGYTNYSQHIWKNVKFTEEHPLVVELSVHPL